MTEAQEDLLIFNVLTQQANGSLADQAAAENWHDELGLEFDVLADEQGEWLFYWGGGQGTSQHSYTVIDSQGRVSWRLATGQSATLRELIAEAEAVE